MEGRASGDRGRDGGLLTRVLARLLGDQAVYDIGNPPQCPIPHQNPYPGVKCLNMTRWGQIVDFAEATGVQLMFGLNGWCVPPHTHRTPRMPQLSRCARVGTLAWVPRAVFRALPPPVLGCGAAATMCDASLE